MSINKDTKKLEMLNHYLSELPEFFYDFIKRNIKDVTTLNTQIAYAKDMKTFLEYLQKTPIFKNLNNLKNFTINDMEKLTKRNIEDYLLYLEDYDKVYESSNGKEIKVKIQNENEGKTRKLSSLRCLFSYLYTSELITKDVTKLVKMPKTKFKVKSRLAVDEVATLLDSVQKGQGLTKKQQSFYDKTKTRDMCILTILLGTGIRISELVNLDIKDINFEEGQFKVIRKGQNEDIIYCNNEVLEAMQSYYEQRKNILPYNEEDYDAFLLSSQNKRIDPKTVRNMIKKYTKSSGIIKNITPHSLRRSFGTNLYNDVGDIYLIAELLGHKSVETTKKHYAQMNLERKREALKNYKLR